MQGASGSHDLTGDGYQHGTVRHGAKEYAYYDYRTGEQHHTYHVKSSWKLFKASVRSTHIHISGKYMDRYGRVHIPVEPPRDGECDV